MQAIQKFLFKKPIVLNIFYLALIGAALAFCIWRLAGLPEQRFDVEIYYYAIDRFNNLGILYHRADGALATIEFLFRPSSPIYKFPPLYLAWVVPLHHWFNIDNFYIVYCLWQLLFYLLSAVLLVLILKPYASLKFLAMVTALIFILSFPFYEAMRATSVELLILCALLITYLTSDRFPRCAGILLAYIGMIKIYPAFMLLYFIARKQWKVIDGCIYGGLFFLLLSVALFGLQENFYYLTTVLPVLMNEPISLQGDNMNLIAGFKDYIGEENIRPLFLVLRTIVLCILAIVCLHKRLATKESHLLLFVFFMIIMQLLLPNYGYNYQVYLQVPAVVSLALFWRRKHYLLCAFSAVLALFLTQNPEWIHLTASRFIEFLAHNSSVFQSQPLEYWEALFNEKGIAVLLEISPLAYRLYWLINVQCLLLPAYFCLILYLLLTQERHRVSVA